MPTSITYNPATTFANLSGNVQVSLLDAELTAIKTAVSGVATAIPDVDNELAVQLRGKYLSGLTLSNDGTTPNTVLDVAVGACASDDLTTSLRLASVFTGSTGGTWVVGTGNNKLDAGAVGNNQWWHVFVIGGGGNSVDILFSLSPTSPTLPGTYTKKRRIGSFKTDGAAHILTFVQDGDYFRWKASVSDVNATNPGTAAVSATLTVPTGVNVQAFLSLALALGAASTSVLLVSDLGANDEAPGALGAAPQGTLLGQLSTTVYLGNIVCRTNTSAQIRYRVSFSDANTKVGIITYGWYDRRGMDT